MVRHGQIEPEQAYDGADKALSLAQRQVEHGPEREFRQDRQRGIPGLAARGRARRRSPTLDSLVGELDRQATTLAQAGVIRAPFHELVLLLGNAVAAVLAQLEQQAGYPRSGWNLLRCTSFGRHRAGPCWGGRPRGISCQGLVVTTRT